MTETLFQKIEEKMMIVLAELEVSRKEIQRLNQENAVLNQENTSLKFEKENNMQKLQGLISLLDTLNLSASPGTNVAIQSGEAVLMQS